MRRVSILPPVLQRAPAVLIPLVAFHAPIRPQACPSSVPNVPKIKPYFDSHCSAEILSLTLRPPASATPPNREPRRINPQG
eukprot:4089325-Pyramimonas_sp.AAC.1